MDLELEAKLLGWIRDEVNYSADSHERLAVSIQFLMIRLACEESTDVTKSTEISLKAFAKASLERALIELYKKKLIHFVDVGGNFIADTLIPRNGRLDLKVLGYVALTNKGRVETQTTPADT